MSVLRTLVASLIVGGVAGAAACSSDRVTATREPGASRAPTTPVAPQLASGPSTPTTSTTPRFLQPAAGAPTIANPVVSFWAKRGVDQTAEMYYHRIAGQRDSIVFFSLRLRARSLWKRPDGTLFADGDSIRITLTLVDAQRGIVDCQPSGLLFEPGRPVRLRVSFAETDSDVNRDGRVDSVDAALTRTFAIWRKETPNDPWLRMPSDVSIGAHEVETEIGGFTGYAIAW